MKENYIHSESDEEQDTSEGTEESEDKEEREEGVKEVSEREEETNEKLLCIGKVFGEGTSDIFSKQIPNYLMKPRQGVPLYHKNTCCSR